MCPSDAAKAGDGARDAPASASRDAAGPGGCFDSEEISRETRRDADFSRLDRAGVAYCDHAGAPPYAESLVRECASALTSTLLGNPHSAHDAAGATSAADAARDATLEHFNAPSASTRSLHRWRHTRMRCLAESFRGPPRASSRTPASTTRASSAYARAPPPRAPGRARRRRARTTETTTTRRRRRRDGARAPVDKRSRDRRPGLTASARRSPPARARVPARRPRRVSVRVPLRM